MWYNTNIRSGDSALLQNLEWSGEIMVLGMPRRESTPERWQAALARARKEGVEVRQLVGSGGWIAPRGLLGGARDRRSGSDRVSQPNRCLTFRAPHVGSGHLPGPIRAVIRGRGRFLTRGGGACLMPSGSKPYRPTHSAPRF